MSQYKVAWLIDIEADTHDQAARKALSIQRNPVSIATCFEVSERSGGAEPKHIDLLWSEASDPPRPPEGAAELLRVTLSALNARPRFRLGHVDRDGKEYPAGREAIRDSYQLASAIEACLSRSAGGEGA